MRLSSQQTHGDVLSESWQGVIQLVNTNYITAHLELLKALTAEETSLDSLFRAFLSQPLCSIYANYLSTFVTYVLYSNTDSSERPLVDYVVRDFNLPKWIREQVAALSAVDAVGARKRLELCALRSFCYELANRLVKAQQESAPQSRYIRDLMKGTDSWIVLLDDWRTEFNIQACQTIPPGSTSPKAASGTTWRRTARTRSTTRARPWQPPAQART